MKIEAATRDAIHGEDVMLTHEASKSESWDAFVRSHPHGSAFHLMAWQRLVHCTFGHEPQHIVASNVRSGNVVGVLPLFLVRSLIFGRILTSTPQAAYGGILASSEAVAQAILQQA